MSIQGIQGGYGRDLRELQGLSRRLQADSSSNAQLQDPKVQQALQQLGSDLQALRGPAGANDADGNGGGTANSAAQASTSTNAQAAQGHRHHHHRVHGQGQGQGEGASGTGGATAAAPQGSPIATLARDVHELVMAMRVQGSAAPSSTAPPAAASVVPSPSA